MIILIPAYQPDAKMLDLVASLREHLRDAQVLVIDDGSGEKYDEVFAAVQKLGAVVRRYPINQGKGAALKRGFLFIEEEFPGQIVVTADCDGQHCAADIASVACRVLESGNLTLGQRRFGGKIPWRSALGNRATTLFFALSTGSWLADTQTGLRAFPPTALQWLIQVPGERYEYELNMLLEARRRSLFIDSVAIEAIYLEGNRSSHFRPITDSARIYAPLLKFTAASLAGFVVDTALLFAFSLISVNLLASVVLARIGSAAVNFWINRQLVFSGARNTELKSTAWRYALLAVCLLAANYELLRLMVHTGVPLIAAKILTEMALFLMSYAVQKRFLFSRGAALNNLASGLPPGAGQIARSARLRGKG
ncbi:bifunctional glycosyltransferase family 2/GtrA family protein [Glutamicibacter sp.]|uniref:bifunctional glycosyltransferase family 2/GtrA family protein n=1 Tax=Glutamicibacter sp. TaxID=1931995 RepID=UPI0028BF53EC|nr:bifunctional glycosyltransferase family 2/GtrA family protein [Glutamicibacter sp.]